MLNMDPVVQVNLNVSSSSVTPGIFDVGAILGPTVVNGKLDADNRFQNYSGLADMADGGVPLTAPEYIAAAKYFGTSPAPARVVVIHYDASDNSAETPTSALMDAINKGAELYGVFYCPKTGETAAKIISNTEALLGAVNSLDKGVLFYGFTGEPAAVVATGSLLDKISASGSRRAMGLYCTSDTSDAAGMMGLAMGMTRTHEGSSFALCYKSIATVEYSPNLTQADVEAIKAMNGNVYVRRTRTRAGLENGAVASGIRVDEVINLDQIKYDIQSGLYTLIADNPNKLPQNDTTNALFSAELDSILRPYTNAGVLATGPWRGADTAYVANGETINGGYKIVTTSFDNQSVADRALRKAPPIAVILCMSGSVESVVVNVNVQT